MENKYSNRTMPKVGVLYSLIVMLNNEWEIIETTGTYSNKWEYDDLGKSSAKSGGKVIAWKPIIFPSYSEGDLLYNKI